MKIYIKDMPILAFTAIGIVAFLASLPATRDLIALYHSPDPDDWVAVAGIYALLVVMEGGAVAAKLSTLFVTRGKWLLEVICVSILSINTIGNLVRSSGYAAMRGMEGFERWGGAFVWGALPPIILYLMMLLAISRVQQLRGESSDITAQVQREVAPLLKMQQQYLQLQQVMQHMQYSTAPLPQVLPNDTAPIPQVPHTTISPPPRPQLGAAGNAAPDTAPQGIYAALREATQHPADETQHPAEIMQQHPSADQQDGSAVLNQDADRTPHSAARFHLDDLLESVGVSRALAQSFLRRHAVTNAEQAYEMLQGAGRLPDGMTLEELKPLFDEIMSQASLWLGKSTGEIAESFGVDRSTVQRWRKKGILRQELEKRLV